MAYVKITSMVAAEVERVQAETEEAIETALALVEDEIDPLQARLDQLAGILTDLQVRVAKLEAFLVIE